MKFVSTNRTFFDLENWVIFFLITSKLEIVINKKKYKEFINLFSCNSCRLKSHLELNLMTIDSWEMKVTKS